MQCPKCMYSMNPREARSMASGTIPHFYHQYLPAPRSPTQGQAASALRSPPLTASYRTFSASERYSKKRRDPRAPKAASNAYMIFCKDRRAQLKTDFPDLPFGQVPLHTVLTLPCLCGLLTLPPQLGARLGQLWRKLSPEEKQVRVLVALLRLTRLAALRGQSRYRPRQTPEGDGRVPAHQTEGWVPGAVNEGADLC